MSRTILFIAAFWLAVPLWGQSGIMPRRSSSIKIPSQETMEKITEADPELVQERMSFRRFLSLYQRIRME